MLASQRIFRTFFARTSCILLCVLAWMPLGIHAALGQQRPLTPTQPQPTHKLNLGFSQEQPHPLAMVSGDFDEDGVQDLVIGYGVADGGSIVLLRGNREAIAPQTEAGLRAAARHEYVEPFLPPSNTLSAKTEPGLMVSADVNGDGHLDLVYSTSGSTQLNVALGDGKGNFLAPFSTQVPGGITALAAYRPGPPVPGEAVIAGYESRTGGGVGLLSFSGAGLSISATYALPAAPTTFAVENLDADFIPDTAIVSGGQLLVLHGMNAISGKAKLETLPVDGVASVAAGDFIFDRNSGVQLSVLTSSGETLFLAHQGFNPQHYTSQELAQARRNSQQHGKRRLTLPSQSAGTGNNPWVEVERQSAPGLQDLGPVTPILLRLRTSYGGGDSLVVLNSSAQQRVTISHSFLSSHLAGQVLAAAEAFPAASSRVEVSSMASGSVVAARSMIVSADGSEGLVLLNDSDVSPEVTDPAAGRTFYVNVTADNTGTTTPVDDGKRCAVNAPPSLTVPTCTLRDAVLFANDDASDNLSAGKSDTINVPSGTYTLTWQAGHLDSNGNAISHLEILGPVTIIGGNATIINAESNDEVFTINPGSYGYYSSIGTANGDSLSFNVTLENLTLENGKNLNNPNNSGTGFSNDVGGCINWDAFGTGNLTITNSVIQKCNASWGGGGGIWAFNSAGVGTGTLTLNGDTISNNSTSEQGGGVYIASAPVALSVTNTSFSNNLASITVNPDDPGGGTDLGDGGGLFINPRITGSGTPQSTLSAVTVSSNTADGNGGGINTNSGILLRTSLIEDNSAKVESTPGTQYLGGGFYIEVASPEVAATVTSTNFLGNSALTSGGGLYVGPDNPSSGTSLQISLSRIVGNTSTDGTTGLGTGSPGKATATENWWGCNAGPGKTGCDGADSGATTTPRAQFLLNATSAPIIQFGGILSLSMSLNTDSAGHAITGAFPAVAADYPYSLSPAGVPGTLPATGVFNSSGNSVAIFVPTGTGNGTITAKFDNQTDSANFQVLSNSTSMVLSVTPSSTFAYGTAPTITAQLSPSNASGITTSDFEVKVDGVLSGSYGLTSLGGNLFEVTGPFNLLTPAVHSVEVLFLGATGYQASHGAAPLTVTQATVIIRDTVTPTNPVQGQGGTVKVTVAGSGATPTGSISYAFDGGTTQSAPLSAGSASIPIPTLIHTGSHTLDLTYSGDPNYIAASSPTTFIVFGRSRTTIASLTSTTATIDVFGFGFTPPGGQLSFTDVTSGTPVAAPVTLNAATAVTSLLPQVTTSTGANTLPVWTELADINDDGKLDLATSLYLTDSVSIQLGNGDGTFQAATDILIAAGFGPAECHFVSLRGNGVLDLIVASFNTNQIAVMLGNGNGTFEAPAFYTVGSITNTPTSLTSGDFNHDGNLDVAVADTGDNTVSILVGNGSGTLSPFGAAIPVGRDPEAIRAGDFNADGYSDLAVANYTAGTVTTLLNNKNGTFASTTLSVGTGAGSGPQALAIHGSGSALLLAVANYKDNTVSVVSSNGNGAFGAPKVISVGTGPDDLTFADLNGDGIPDLVVANYTSGNVSLALGSAGGGYTVLGPFGVGTNPYSAAVGDLNLDGTPDIVVSNCFSNNTGVLLSGTQISVPYGGLSFAPGNTLNAAYTPDGASKYGPSTSPNVTAP